MRTMWIAAPNAKVVGGSVGSDRSWVEFGNRFGGGLRSPVIDRRGHRVQPWKRRPLKRWEKLTLFGSSLILADTIGIVTDTRAFVWCLIIMMTIGMLLVSAARRRRAEMTRLAFDAEYQHAAWMAGDDRTAIFGRYPCPTTTAPAESGQGVSWP